MTTVATQCPECGKRYAVREQTIGKKVACQACGVPFVATAEDGNEYGLSGGAATTPKPAPAARPADLSDLLDDKSTHSAGDQLDDEPRQPRKVVRKPEPKSTDDHSGDNLKAAGMIAASLVGVALLAWGFYNLRLPERKEKKPSGPPTFVLSQAETYREKSNVIASVRYTRQNEGKLLAGQRLYWILEGGGDVFDLDVTDSMSSSGFLDGRAIELRRGDIVDILEMRIELVAYDGTRTTVSNSVTSKIPHAKRMGR
jgi:hypothetical protein